MLCLCRPQLPQLLEQVVVRRGQRRIFCSHRSRQLLPHHRHTPHDRFLVANDLHRAGSQHQFLILLKLPQCQIFPLDQFVDQLHHFPP